MGRMGDFWQPAEDDLQGLKAAGNRSEDPETHRDGQDEKQQQRQFAFGKQHRIGRHQAKRARRRAHNREAK